MQVSSELINLLNNIVCINRLLPGSSEYGAQANTQRVAEAHTVLASIRSYKYHTHGRIFQSKFLI